MYNKTDKSKSGFFNSLISYCHSKISVPSCLQIYCNSFNLISLQLSWVKQWIIKPTNWHSYVIKTFSKQQKIKSSINKFIDIHIIQSNTWIQWCYILLCSDLFLLIFLTLLAYVQRPNWMSAQGPQGWDIKLFNPCPLYL